jgi:late competence protein required for DNA uptake (superfamily II DNA/RNA helicase)
LSTKLEKQIQWRRSKVAELDSQGHSQPEMASILQVSIGTVNRDLSYLRQQAKHNIRRYIDERNNEKFILLIFIVSVLYLQNLESCFVIPIILLISSLAMGKKS